MKEDPKFKVCSVCGWQENPRAYSWNQIEEPHADPAVCIRNLRERLERVEQILESHNL